MARARNIKPSFFDNDELADVAPLGRLLFIGLWTLADFRGNLEWRDRRIKKQLLAYDDCDISELAINLDKSGFIRFYSDGDKTYLNVSNFTKHQNPHKNERDKGSEIPEITNDMRQAIDLNTLTINRDLSGLKRNSSTSNPADSLVLIPDSRSLIPETNSKELIENAFDIFYSAGLVKKSKIKALSTFKSLVKQMSCDPMEFAELLKRDIEYRINNNQFGIDKLHPSTYLNQQRWTDEYDSQESNNGIPQAVGKQSASERITARNNLKYGNQQPSGGLGMAANGGDLREPVGEGEWGNTIAHVEDRS